jgi:hypothetical protein
MAVATLATKVAAAAAGFARAWVTVADAAWQAAKLQAKLQGLL